MSGNIKKKITLISVQNMVVSKMLEEMLNFSLICVQNVVVDVMVSKIVQ